MEVVSTVTKTRYIGFKLTETEYQIIKDKIARSGLSISRFSLAAMLNKEIVTIPEIKGFITELNCVGNNLNQLTILAHKGNIKTAYLTETLETLNAIHKELLRIRR